MRLPKTKFRTENPKYGSKTRSHFMCFHPSQILTSNNLSSHNLTPHTFTSHFTPDIFSPHVIFPNIGSLHIILPLTYSHSIISFNVIIHISPQITSPYISHLTLRENFGPGYGAGHKWKCFSSLGLASFRQQIPCGRVSTMEQ